MDKLEFCKVSRKGDHRAVYAVKVAFVAGVKDEGVVGYVFGRPDKWNGPRWWDYKVGYEPPTTEDFVRAVYGSRARAQAAENLMSALSRRNK